MRSEITTSLDKESGDVMDGHILGVITGSLSVAIALWFWYEGRKALLKLFEYLLGKR